MKKGFKQTKTPTKKELVKIRKSEAFKALDLLEGSILEITDMFDDDTVPLNLLKLELDKIRLGEDLGLPKEWIESWNKLIDIRKVLLHQSRCARTTS